MATNAKQYTDLLKATTLNNDDLVAIAQSGATELKTTSTEALANKVGSIIQDGAYAELTYATSQGKNLLATNLRNKGVTDAQPTDTLIKLADDVNNLEVATNYDSILAKMKTAITSVNAANTYGSYVRVNAAGDVVYMVGQTIYYIPYGEYTTYAEFLAGAKFSVTDTDVSVGYTQYAAVSLDGTKLCVRTVNSNFKIYDITDTEFQFVKSVSVSPSYGPTQCAHGITNDGVYIVYKSSTTARDPNIVMYNTSTNVAYSTSEPQMSYSGYSTPMEVVIKNNTIYFLYQYSLFKIDYSADVEGVVTYSNALAIDLLFNTSNSAWGHMYPYGNEMVYILNPISDTISNNLAKYGSVQTKLYFATDATITATSMAPYITVQWTTNNGNTSSYLQYNLGYTSLSYMPVTINSDGTLTFSSAKLPRTITYDPVTNTLDDTSDIFIVDATSQSSSSQQCIPLYDNPATQTIIATYSPLPFISTSTIVNISYTTDLKLYGKLRTINSETYAMRPYMYVEAKIIAGAYDIDTRLAPPVDKN